MCFFQINTFLYLPYKGIFFIYIYLLNFIVFFSIKGIESIVLKYREYSDKITF